MIRWLFGLLLVAALVIVSISLYLQPNDFTACGKAPEIGSSKCGTADAIVVVSGGDTSARTETGIRLFNEGWAKSLVFSGAAQDKSGPSNAAAMKQLALHAGVPSEAIFIDEESANTQENAANSQSIFQDNNFNEVILVTSGYHQRRASLEFNKHAQDITIRNHPVTEDAGWSWFWWLTPGGWWLAGGELAKIIAFYAGATS